MVFLYPDVLKRITTASKEELKEIMREPEVKEYFGPRFGKIGPILFYEGLTMSEQAELPRYKCHKEVWGLKLSSVFIGSDKRAVLVPEDQKYSSFIMNEEWVKRFKPDQADGYDPGYYVLYKGGYESWSPTIEFEDGYSRVDQ